MAAPSDAATVEQRTGRLDVDRNAGRLRGVVHVCKAPLELRCADVDLTDARSTAQPDRQL
jgi:hypothetical protein